MVISDGRRQYAFQCLSCGRRVGPFQPKPSAAAGIGQFDADLRERRAAAQAAANQRIRQEEGHRKHAEYENYIRTSPLWMTRRRLVLSRAKGICEACLGAAATEVHHEDYDFLFNEVLWLLRAVCHECHQKIHGRRF